MPRRRITGDLEARPTSRTLLARLVDELKSHRETGQPMIYEQVFEGERLSVTVVWDEWAGVSLEDRTSTILEAYSKAESNEFRKKIVLASGLTVPEAESAGMLPFQIIPAVRKSDPVTLDECQQAMIDVGASILTDPSRPQLRFATEDEAGATIDALVKQLPESEPIWTILREVGKVDDWLLR